MKVTILLSIISAIVAVASAGYALPATTLYRTPHYDNAIVHSTRSGGNFAYSTIQGHAYTAVSPIVQHVTSPVALSYNYPYYYNYLHGYPSIFQYPIPGISTGFPAGYPGAYPGAYPGTYPAGIPAATPPVRPVAPAAPIAPGYPIGGGDGSLSFAPGSGVEVA